LTVHLDVVDRLLRRKLQEHARQAWLECGDVVACELAPILLIVLRSPSRCVIELAPRGRDPSHRLVAKRQVEKRSELRCELQALTEVRACLCVLAGVELLSGGAEEHLGAHLVRWRRGGRIRRRRRCARRRCSLCAICTEQTTETNDCTEGRASRHRDE